MRGSILRKRDSRGTSQVAAKAAVDAGAFGLKFHLNAYHRASGTTFGSFAEERPFIEELAKLGKPMLVMSGQETQPTLDELNALADYGVEGWNIYLKHVQPHLFEARLKPILALDADDNAETVRERLTAYHAQTAPLIAHYDRLSVLERVPAMGSIDGIRARLAEIVGRVAA